VAVGQAVVHPLSHLVRTVVVVFDPCRAKLLRTIEAKTTAIAVEGVGVERKDRILFVDRRGDTVFIEGQGGLEPSLSSQPGTAPADRAVGGQLIPPGDWCRRQCLERLRLRRELCNECLSKKKAGTCS